MSKGKKELGAKWWQVAKVVEGIKIAGSVVLFGGISFVLFKVNTTVNVFNTSIQKGMVVSPVTASSGGTAVSTVNSAAGSLGQGTQLIANRMEGLWVNLGKEEDAKKARDILLLELDLQVAHIHSRMGSTKHESELLGKEEMLVGHIPPFDLSVWSAMKVTYPKFLRSLGGKALGQLASFYNALASLNLRLNERHGYFANAGTAVEIARANDLFTLQAEKLLEEKWVEMVIAAIEIGDPPSSSSVGVSGTGGGEDAGSP